MRTAAATVLCSLLLLSGCRSVTPRPRPAEPSLTREEQRLARALAYFAQGLIYEGEEGPDSTNALAAFAEAADLDPARHRLHARVALSYLRRKDPGRAIAALERSCRANPDELEPRMDLAVACQLTGRDELACEHYARALRISPTNAMIFVELARLNFRQDKDRRAVNYIERGLRESDAPEAVLRFCNELGRQSVHAGQIERAVRCFEVLAANAQASLREIYHVLGELQEELGRDEEALNSFARAAAEDEPLPASFVRMALIQFQSDPAQALATLEDADRRVPGSPAILSVLAVVYSSEEQHARALATFERVRQIVEAERGEPLDRGFFMRYGSACDLAGEEAKAEQVFEECIGKHPDAHEALNYVAYMWAEKGINLERAKSCVDRALAHEPDNGAYLDTLGWVYFQQQHYEQALEYLLRADRALAGDPVISDHIGDAYKALGDETRAIEFWKRSYGLDAGNEAVVRKLRIHGVEPDDLP